jgi:hypothetical protein
MPITVNGVHPFLSPMYMNQQVPKEITHKTGREGRVETASNGLVKTAKNLAPSFSKKKTSWLG